VWVTVRDENDNAPRFAQERYVSAVWEGNDRGTYVTQVSAADADSGDNGRVSYTIIGGNTGSAFVIDPPTTGIVKTNVILDREITPQYKLEIEAADMAPDGNYLTSTCILKINVIDLNDNSPQFPLNPPPIILREGTELGTMLPAVTANDIDLNPILLYDFAPGGNPGDTFSIDTFSGKLALAKPLDHEQRTNYILIIRVSSLLAFIPSIHVPLEYTYAVL
jgi:protocadherin-16/23